MKKTICLLVLFLPLFGISQQSFVNSTNAVGINVGTQSYGHASAWGDIDADGDLDLGFSYNSGGTFKLFVNNNNSFEDISASAGLSNIGAGSIFWADIDKDGYNDLLTTNKYYKNNGDLTFAGGISINGANAINNLCDLNNDGFLDILNLSPPSIVFGQADGSFGEIYTFSANNISAVACLDYNADGKMDLLFANNGSGQNKLFKNEGDGTFTDVSASSNIPTNTSETSGIAIGDINNDGFPDIYLAIHIGQNEDPENILLLNNTDGSFSNITNSAGVFGQPSSRTAIFFDYDNDGFLDLLVDDHYRGNFLYHNNHDHTFEEVAEQLDIRDVHPQAGIGGDYFGTSVGDFNNDGASDIFVTGHWSIYKLYENTNCPNNFLQIELKGVESDANAIGAKIKIIAGDLVLHRWISPAESMNDFYAYPINMGLANQNNIEELEISWPSGLVQTFSNISVNQRIEIIEGDNSVGIKDIPNTINNAYPNPFKEQIHLQIEDISNAKNIVLKLYNINGEYIENVDFDIQDNHTLLCQIQSRKAGTYILTVFANEVELGSKKVVIN